MLRRILAIAGRPGLFRLVNQGKNMLIVEDIVTGKRVPAYARDRVSSLGDISIYAVDGDRPLAEVFEMVKEKNDGKPVDLKAVGDLREYFATVFPEFDNDRVYTADIKKLLQWYNLLVNNGITDFVEGDAEETQPDGETEA